MNPPKPRQPIRIKNSNNSVNKHNQNKWLHMCHAPEENEIAFANRKHLLSINFAMCKWI